ncbi:TPA: hypothetical protein U0F32_004935, partial [Escherichia coli]|nr:hypothetical protein [Escherichia coli]
EIIIVSGKIDDVNAAGGVVTISFSKSENDEQSNDNSNTYSGVANADGAWSISISASEFENGETYTYTVTVTDAAKNTTEYSGVFTYSDNDIEGEGSSDDMHTENSDSPSVEVVAAMSEVHQQYDNHEY